MSSYCHSSAYRPSLLESLKDAQRRMREKSAQQYQQWYAQTRQGELEIVLDQMRKEQAAEPIRNVCLYCRSTVITTERQSGRCDQCYAPIKEA